LVLALKKKERLLDRTHSKKKLLAAARPKGIIARKKKKNGGKIFRLFSSLPEVFRNARAIAFPLTSWLSKKTTE